MDYLLEKSQYGVMLNGEEIKNQIDTIMFFVSKSFFQHSVHQFQLKINYSETRLNIIMTNIYMNTH